MQNQQDDPNQSPSFNEDSTVADLQVMLAEADAADAPAIAERIAVLLGDSLDGSGAEGSEGSH